MSAPCKCPTPDWSFDPIPVQLYPPQYAAVCRGCGTSTVVASSHVPGHDPLQSDHAGTMKKHGHVPRPRPVATFPSIPCVHCGKPAVTYNKAKRPVCDAKACGGRP